MLGDKLNINKVLLWGSALAFIAYIVIVFSPVNAPAVAAIALCGLFVSLLWPGTLAVASRELPAAGASLFALLAASGSLGCSIGPWVSGIVTDFTMLRLPAWTNLGAEQFGLRAGLLAGAALPLASLVSQIALKRVSGKNTAAAGDAK
jgi:MFS family permease